MNKFFMVAFVVCILFGVTPASAKILLYDDCENQWKEGTDWNPANTGGGNTISVSSAQKRAGNKSYKFVLAPESSGAETNVELVLRGLNSPVQLKNFLIGKEYWIGYSIYIPKWFKFNDFWTSPQFHLAQDSCDARGFGPNVGMFLTSKKYKISIGGDPKSCTTSSGLSRSVIYSPSLVAGKWNDVVLHFKFSPNSDGFFKIWLNGDGPITNKGTNCSNDVKGPYMKLGIYAHAVDTMTVYYDEIRIGDHNSSYNEVKPKGASPLVIDEEPLVIDEEPPPASASKLDPPTLSIVQ